FPAPKNQDSRQIHRSFTPLGQLGDRAHLGLTRGLRPESLRPPVAAPARRPPSQPENRRRLDSRRLPAHGPPTLDEGGSDHSSSRRSVLPGPWSSEDRGTAPAGNGCLHPWTRIHPTAAFPIPIRKRPTRPNRDRPGPVRLECQTPAIMPSFPTSLHCAQADTRPSNPRFDGCRGPGIPPAPRRHVAGLHLVVAPDLPGLSLTAAGSWR